MFHLQSRDRKGAVLESIDSAIKQAGIAEVHPVAAYGKFQTGKVVESSWGAVPNPSSPAGSVFPRYAEDHVRARRNELVDLDTEAAFRVIDNFTCGEMRFF